MKVEKQRYGLMTVITMIVGICVGSGIFFKADDILRYTQGNVLLGVVVLCLGAFSIIFGSISLTELAMRTEKNGGVVGYFEDFTSLEIASAFGWFQTFLYLPSIQAVVAWAAGIYTLMMLGIEGSLELQVLVGIIYLLFFYIMNYFSLRASGYVQILTTYVKLVPLLGVAILGLFWKPEITTEAVNKVVSDQGSWYWLAALAPVAFSYEGWNISTSISNEVKNSKRNMPIALLVGPLIVLAVYVLYFIGLTNILSPEYILSVGDEAIYKIGEALMGSLGGPIITLFVVISVIGVVNGLTIGSLRMPHALATKKMMPFSSKIEKVNPKNQLSMGSFYMSLFLVLFWMGIHYITQKMNVLPGGDISEIAIVFSYVCYPLLYVKIMKMYKEKEITSVFKGIVAPVCGTIGSIIIVCGGILSNPVNVIICIVICFVFCLAGYGYYKKTA